MKYTASAFQLLLNLSYVQHNPAKPNPFFYGNNLSNSTDILYNYKKKIVPNTCKLQRCSCLHFGWWQRSGTAVGIDIANIATRA